FLFGLCGRFDLGRLIGNPLGWAERSEELNEQFYASLRDSYTIVIEEPAAQDDVAVVPESSR
ncbi:MAG: hypothetical protein JRE57_09070, partial [Deltaproteobacteria bacterium]|nr:hypothetical protein [Deltaproteobacteria bacterium]